MSLDEYLGEVAPELEARPGLRALPAGARQHISVSETRALDGSADIDGGLARLEPNAPRWDYVVMYRGCSWFIEVHPATAGRHVDEVVRKASWLVKRFRGSPLIRRPPAGVLSALVWVASGKISRQPAFSRKRRLLAKNGVTGPVERLTLG